MIKLGEVVMILDLHREGLAVTAIARRTGHDPKTFAIERGLPTIIASTQSILPVIR